MEQNSKALTPKETILLAEEQHLRSCIGIIRENISRLDSEVAKMKAETKEMYDNYRSGDSELHNELVIGLDLQNNAEHTLYKNLQAEQKAYFGRIDYEEEYHEGLVRKEGEPNPKFSLYIGKNGIMQSSSDILIVDWRAPVASVYYDSDIGKSHYEAPTGENIRIDLQLKRTFELEWDRIFDFYDTDVITNDEFLTKYLAKNKEVVLGEIIATIQKEQNTIIRDTPWHTVIVQGVAGSGKTTVAMHRISYILYNFKEKFKPQEFYVIGSNHMLLNYITSVLPSLDVQGINQMTLTEMMLRFLDGDVKAVFPAVTGRNAAYTIVDSFSRLSYVRGESEERQQQERELLHLKGSLDFSLALEYYLVELERRTLRPLPEEGLCYEGKLLYGKEDIAEFLHTFSCFCGEEYYQPTTGQVLPAGTTKPGGVSAEERIDMLNQRLLKKVRMICELADEDREYIRKELAKFRGYFGKAKGRWKVTEVYESFLRELAENTGWFLEKGLHLPENSVLMLLKDGFMDHQADIYDLAQMLLIKKRMKWCDDLDLVSHVVVDEAQDFGVSAFYSLRQAFPTTTFTIMGDVSQNIYYDAGMNDWTELREQVFSAEKDRFYRLVKSYRNTVEISHFAGEILKKGTFETYAIDPVIRHGREVESIVCGGFDVMAEEAERLICEMQERGMATVAVICRDQEECSEVYAKLSESRDVTLITEEVEDISSLAGVMVLPISMIKGLEFDSVIIWNPSERKYPFGDANVKLLYVAVTRALHELYLLWDNSSDNSTSVDEKGGLCRILTGTLTGVRKV